MHASHYPSLLGSIRVVFDPPLESIWNKRWFETLSRSGAWVYGYDSAHADGMDFWAEYNNDGEVISARAYLYAEIPCNPDLMKTYWDERHRAILDESLETSISPITMKVLEFKHGFRFCWFQSDVHTVLTRLVVVDGMLAKAYQWAWK